MIVSVQSFCWTPLRQFHQTMPLLGDDASDGDGLVTTKVTESRPGRKKKPEVVEKGALDLCLGAGGSPDNVLVVDGEGKRLEALKSDIVLVAAEVAIPLIQLAGATGDDCSLQHPFDHDEKACAMKKCWMCLVKVNFVQWQREVGCYAMPNGMQFSWLIERPERFQGQCDGPKSGNRPWAVGCILCFNYANKRGTRTCKWGRFEIPVKKAKSNPGAPGESPTHIGNCRSLMFDCPRATSQCPNKRSPRTGYADQFSIRPPNIRRLDPSCVFHLEQEQCLNLGAALQ